MSRYNSNRGFLRPFQVIRVYDKEEEKQINESILAHDCTFFDEAQWGFVTVKMYCSSPKYHKYYIDKQDPLKNIYTDVQFGFVEE